MLWGAGALGRNCWGKKGTHRTHGKNSPVQKTSMSEATSSCEGPSSSPAAPSTMYHVHQRVRFRPWAPTRSFQGRLLQPFQEGRGGKQPAVGPLWQRPASLPFCPFRLMLPLRVLASWIRQPAFCSHWSTGWQPLGRGAGAVGRRGLLNKLLSTRCLWTCPFD